MSESSSTSEGSCLGTILLFILIWILLFGVSFGGKHYGLGFSCDNGVTVETGIPIGVDAGTPLSE